MKDEKQPDYYLITAGDLRKLEHLKTRLFTETTMRGDEMRDNAEALRLMIERAEPVE